MNVVFIYRYVDKSESFENKVKDDFSNKVGKLSLDVRDVKVELSRDGSDYVVTINSSAMRGTTISVSKRSEKVLNAYDLAFNTYIRQLKKCKTKIDKLRREKSHSKDGVLDCLESEYEALALGDD